MSDTKPLPFFLPIAISEIPSASILQFYGGNKLTEFYGNKRYGFPYKPPPFHSAFYCKDGLFLNVGKFKTIEPLEKEFRSTRRIDVIIYKELTQDVRDMMIRNAFLAADNPKIGFNLPTYGIRDYIRFEPYLRWLFPKDKRDFCSEDVTKRFNAAGCEVSKNPSNRTAPWDLTQYAIDNTYRSEIRTLHIGKDFK